MLGWKKIYCARKKRCFSGMSSLRHLDAYQLRYTDPPKCVHFFGWSIRPDVFVIFLESSTNSCEYFWWSSTHSPAFEGKVEVSDPSPRLEVRPKGLTRFLVSDSLYMTDKCWKEKDNSFSWHSSLWWSGEWGIEGFEEIKGRAGQWRRRR